MLKETEITWIWILNMSQRHTKLMAASRHEVNCARRPIPPEKDSPPRAFGWQETVEYHLHRQGRVRNGQSCGNITYAGASGCGMSVIHDMYGCPYGTICSDFGRYRWSKRSKNALTKIDAA